MRATVTPPQRLKPELRPDLVLELLVERRAVLHERRAGLRRAELADQPGRMPRRPGRELALLEQHDVALAGLGQVIGDARADDPAADDDDPCPGRQRHVAASSQVSNRGIAEVRDGLVEALLAPAVEVEVVVVRRRLDEAPQRPAVARHRGLEPGAGDQRRVLVADVRRDELGQVIVVELALGPRVAQLEVGVVVAGVVVVDQPEPLAVVDDVAGEQVVVARDGRQRPRRESALDAEEVRAVRDVVVRHREAAADAGAQVGRLTDEHVEVRREPRAAVQHPHHRREPRERTGRTEVFVDIAVAADVPDHERSEVRAVVDEWRAGARRLRGPGVVGLGVTVDAEQRAVAAGEPDDVRAGRGSRP